LKLGFQKI